MTAPNIATTNARRTAQAASVANPYGGGFNPENGAQNTLDGQPTYTGGMPTNTAGSAGSGGIPGMSNYSADSNLIGTQIAPQDSDRLNNYNGYVDKAAQGVNDFQYQPWQSQGPLSNQGNAQFQGIGPTAQRQAGQTDSGPATNYLNASTQQGAGGNAATSSLIGMLGGGGGGGAGFSYAGPGADVGKARAQAMSQLTSSLNSPDRQALAQQSFNLLRDQGQTGFEQDQRSVGQKAAALGRVGAGMTTNDLTGLAQSRDKNLSFANRDLSLQAADKTLQDNIDKTNLASKTALGFAGSDNADAGLNLQGAALGEQSAARMAGNRISAAGQLNQADQFNRTNLRGVGNDVFGMGQTNTAERGADANRGMATDQFNTGIAERKANSQSAYDLNAYDRAVAERDTNRADQYRQDTAGQTRLQGMSRLQNDQRANEAANRQELRGERGYQNDQSNAAQSNAIEQQRFNEWLRNSGWNRTVGAANQGYGYDPSQTAAGVSRGG